MKHFNPIKDQKWARVYCAEALSDQGGRCFYCRMPMSVAIATADHKVPQIFGGETSRKNIAAACRDCNMAKGSLTANEFVRLIKSPYPGIEIFIWMAWSRRRIFLAAERACTRLSRFAGLPTPAAHRSAA